MRARLLAGLLAATVGLVPAPLVADEITIGALTIETFRGAAYHERVGELIWRGGLELTSPDPEFGGLSGIAFTGAGGAFAMVTDAGQFISARLIGDADGAPVAIAAGNITAIRNSKGDELPTPFSRDAEAIDTIVRDGAPAAVRVGFENLTRVADFTLENGRPVGAAREVSIPDWLSRTRTNQSLEAVCIATPASPIAGSTLLIAEDIGGDNGGGAAWLLGNRDRGPVEVERAAGLSPTACAFGPDGELYLLERGIALLSFRMRLRRIPAEEVVPGATLRGEVLIDVSGGEIDNMEGLAVSQGPNGETILTVLSDDNFNDWERTLLLQFEVPE